MAPDDDIDGGLGGPGMRDGDPRGLAPITLELNRTLAELLARLCVELETDDATGVMSRAIGLLDLAQQTKRRGGRLCFINPRGEIADVIF
jgi:pimeloyl-CoA synthetase